jgi:hypothetical protein
MTEIDTDIAVTLPSGEKLAGRNPVVVIGPNGSGKTRKTREITAEGQLEFVNALRNTRVAAQIPFMAAADAKNNFESSRNQARQQHWELSNEFDSLLAKLLADDSSAAIDVRDSIRAGQTGAGELTNFEKIRILWTEVFPDRELSWKDHAPKVKSSVPGNVVEYAANTMSDGERAALYLAGRVFTANPGVLVVDEPETHFHTSLAVRLWDLLEAARPDVRFVYVTHDLTFALSRSKPYFVLASPTDGLTVLNLDASLPDEVAAVLLGAASFSFYARRVVLCEGDESSPDAGLYRAWFEGSNTVVRSVGGSDMVVRCVSALRESGLIQGAETLGIIDRDYGPDSLFDALPTGVQVLPLHEVESLYCLPAVASAVADHVKHTFDETRYIDELRASADPLESHRVTLERWKRRLEPLLEGLVSSVTTKNTALEELESQIPELFDHQRWNFSPAAILVEEKTRVDTAAQGTVEDVLRVMPGKHRLAVAAKFVGLKADDYRLLINRVLGSVLNDDAPFRKRLEAALEACLPSRTAS